MFRKSLVSSMYALLLIGCTGRGFQPPPPEFTNWKKIGVSEEDVKHAMTACGYTNLIGTGDRTPIDQVLTQFYCMKDAGFKRTDNIDLCKEGRIGESPVCEGRR